MNNVLESNGSNRQRGVKRDSDGYGWLSRGYLYLDARTATEFGTLRAYVSMYATNVQRCTNSTTLDNAYIQWGRSDGRSYLGSNFNIYTGQTFVGVVTRDWSDKSPPTRSPTPLLSATACLRYDRSGRPLCT